MKFCFITLYVLCNVILQVHAAHDHHISADTTLDAFGGVLAEFYLPYNSFTWNDVPNINGLGTTPYAMYYLTDQFEDTGSPYNNQNYFARYSAFFMPPEKGTYTFYLICKGRCTLRVTHKRCGASSTDDEIHTSYNVYSYTSMSASKSHDLEHHRYCLEVYHRGGQGNTNRVGLGIKYPDGTEDKPMTFQKNTTDTIYLTPDSYFGRLAILNYYFGSGSSFDTVAGFLTTPEYNNQQISKTTALEEIHAESRQSKRYGTAFGSVISGYLYLYKAKSYEFKLKCYRKCQVEINDVALGAEMDDGTYPAYNPSMNKYYKMVVYHTTKDNRNDHLKLEVSINGGAYNVVTLKMSTFNDAIQLVDITDIESTQFVVTVKQTWIRPQPDFLMTGNYTLYIQRSDGIGSIQEVVNDTINVPLIITGLNEYTEYMVWVVYSVSPVHKVRNSAKLETTLEDLPSAPPTSLTATTVSSTQLTLNWGEINAEDKNGIITYYIIEHAETLPNGTIVGEWIEKTTFGNATVRNLKFLKFWTFYSLRIAGKTSVGTGVFSNIIVQRTDEDAPTEAPLNPFGFNVSHTIIQLKWDYVNDDHQNGLITQHEVQYWKDGDEATPDTQFVLGADSLATNITDLEWFRWYNFKLAAHTSKGRGPFTNDFRVRTDEWIPEISPTILNITISSTGGLDVAFDYVRDEDILNGYLAETKIEYVREDDPTDNGEIIVNADNVHIEGLKANRYFLIKMAVGTVKGFGPYSTTVRVLTDDSVPSLPPTNIRTKATKSTELLVIWYEIPAFHQEGSILSYNITYRKANSSDDWQTVLVNNTAPTMSVLLTGLDRYRHYDVMISGMTKYGTGVFSTPGEYAMDPRLFRTGEDIPDEPPINLAVHTFESDSINVTWDEVPYDSRRGVITGYRIQYRDTTRPDPPVWKTKNVNANERTLTIDKLKYFTDYAVQISASTRKGFSNYSTEVINRTGEAAPNVYPSNFTCGNMTSSKLKCQWGTVPEGDGFSNGVVLGYYLYVHIVSCHEAELAVPPCNESAIVEYHVKTPNLEIEIGDLEYFTTYAIEISLYNSFNDTTLSEPTPTFHASTDEDIPSIKPPRLEAYSSTLNSVLVFWDPIPYGRKHSIIRGYHIYYTRIQPLSVTEQKAEAKRKKESQNRRRRSLSPVIEKPVYEILARHYITPVVTASDLISYPTQLLTVNHTLNDVEITGLATNQWYNFKIMSFSSKGVGPSDSINQSCAQSLPISGPNVTIFDLYTYYEFEVTFEELEYAYARGTVFEYAIRYYPIERNGLELAYFERVTKTIWVEYPVHGVIIKDLTAFTRYVVQVAALTYAGLGPYSRIVYAETCRCTPTMTTSFRNLNPIFHMDPVTRERTGFIADIVLDAGLSCCGNCINGHGRTHINLTHDPIGESTLKNDNRGLKEALDHDAHFVFPLQNGANRVNFYQYPYISIVESPGIAIYSSRIDHLNNTAKMVAATTWQIWTYIVLFIMFAIISGFIMYIIQCNPMQFYRSNEEFYPDTFRVGGISGVWWAVNTLFRLGGGDIPVGTGKLTRAYSMFVQVLGVVMYTVIVSSTTVNFITYCFTLSSMNIYTENVATLNDSYDSLVVRRWGGNVATQGSTPEELLSILSSGQVSRLAVDSLYTSYYNEKFKNDPNAVFRGIKDAQSSYGLVLSQGAEKLETCMRQYINDQKPKISKQVAQLVDAVEPSFAPNEVLSKLDALGSREVIQWLMTVACTGGLIVLFLLMGCVYECRRRNRNKVYAFEVEHTPCYQWYEKECLQMIVKFREDSMKMLSKYELKHAKQRLDLKENLRKTIKFLTPDQVNKYRF